MKQQISVIIPAHDEETYIAKTIAAFQKQTLKPLEIIIVCDACTDQTEKIARKLGVKVLVKNYRNPSKTRNAGIKAAKGKILVLQDADSLPAENYLEKISEAIQLGYIFGGAQLTPETSFFIARIRLHLMNLCSVVFGGYSGSSFFATKEALLKTELYNPDIPWAEDWDIAMQLKKHGKWKTLFDTYSVYSERRMRENGYWHEYSKRLLKVMEYGWYSLKKNLNFPATS